MISLIFAVDKNNLIGKDNNLPWHYKEDLQYFKNTTSHKTVLMGRKTFESIISRLKKPLPNRLNIVATRRDFSYEGVEVVKDLEQFLKQPHKEEIFVIGGKMIYDVAFKYADRLYITHIDKAYDGDTYLEYDLKNFKLIKETKSDDLRFCIYERI